MNICTFVGTVSREPKRSVTKRHERQITFCMHVEDARGKSSYPMFQAFGAKLDQCHDLVDGSVCSVVCTFGSFKAADGWVNIFTCNDIQVLHSPEQATDPDNPANPANFDTVKHNRLKKLGGGFDNGFAANHDDVPF
jgi:hypothetical protein